MIWDDDQSTLRAFHRAGFYLPAERRAIEHLAAIRIHRRREVARLAPPTMAAVVVLMSVSTWAYALGRDAEAQLTLDAYDKAEYATELLRRYLPLGETALTECLAFDSDLREQLARLPLYGRVAKPSDVEIDP